MKFKLISPSMLWSVILFLLLSVTVVRASGPIGSAFTYDGRLTDGGAPANGSYDFRFKLFDALTNGTQQGSIVTKDDVPVSAGLFSVQLDFGANVFNGTERYLEILVRAGSSTGGYTTLSPRQLLTATPYALFSTKPWVTSGNDISYTQGKVGIGTLAPANQLHVRDTTNFLQGVFDGGNQTAGIALKGGRQWELQSVDPGTAIAPGAFIVYDRTGSAYRMVVSSAGNIGIGTTNPLNKLDVAGNSDFMGNVGIGTTNPSAKLDVMANTASGGANSANFADSAIGPNVSHIHWGTTGDWYIRSAANGGKVILQDSGGNVGIGTNNPTDKLTVAGTINSTSGGYKFPDSSIQTTATGNAYTIFRDGTTAVEVAPKNSTPKSVLQLALPPGTYLIEATVWFSNNAMFVGQDNSRKFSCALQGDSYWIDIGGGDSNFGDLSETWHTVKIVTGQPTTNVDVTCRASNGGTDRSYVFATNRRLTAVTLGNVTVQP